MPSYFPKNQISNAFHLNYISILVITFACFSSQLGLMSLTWRLGCQSSSTPQKTQCMCVFCVSYYLQRDLIYILIYICCSVSFAPCYPLSPRAGATQPFPSKHIISMPVLTQPHISLFN